MERPTSDCCNALIVNSYNGDVCSNCGNAIHYALEDSLGFKEAHGVFERKDGSLWFFWQQTNQWEFVIGRLKHKDIYLGQVNRVIDTLGMRYNLDPDMLSYKEHKDFIDEYRSKVKNAEVANL
jgi:hypothetical protein